MNEIDQKAKSALVTALSMMLLSFDFARQMQSILRGQTIEPIEQELILKETISELKKDDFNYALVWANLYRLEYLANHHQYKSDNSEFTKGGMVSNEQHPYDFTKGGYTKRKS